MALNLYMVLIGCRPKGRHTEQHDIFFGIASALKDLIPEMYRFWPGAKGNMHIDGWRVVSRVNGHEIAVIPVSEKPVSQNQQLFFINLGGYKENEFEEFHYKLITAAPDKTAAIREAKQTAFFKHTHFEGANSHIDDKYGVDVDDIYEIEEILSPETKQQYALLLTPAIDSTEDILHLGYFKLDKL